MTDGARLEGLYADVKAAGSLTAGLQKALETGGSRLRVDPSLGPWWARVSLGNRFSQITVAVEHRLFIVDFWNDLICCGHARDPNLERIASMIFSFIEEYISIDAMPAAFPTFVGSEEACAYEKGKLVEFKWTKLLASGDQYLLPAAAALLRAASDLPAMRRLHPFTSHGCLCFGGPQVAPQFGECFRVVPVGEGRVRIYQSVGSNVLRFEGETEQAFAFLVHNLGQGGGEPAPDPRQESWW